MKRNMTMTTMCWVFLCIFILGMFVMGYTTHNNKVEGFGNKCQNVLVQKGAKFYLYNTSQVEVPGVNPIEFDHLEDYTEFLQWQKSQGLTCPVLYLQSAIDAQGNLVLQSRPSVSEPQGGLPPTTPVIIPPPSFPDAADSSSSSSSDPTGVGGGKTVLSPDAMDDNWGGPEYTDTLIAQGYYKGNQVSMY